MCVLTMIFFLSTPLGRTEYVKIQLSKIPEESIKEYNLTTLVHKGWVYFEIRQGCYGLPQSGMLANRQLRERLEKRGIMKQELPQGYGDKNGDQYNFF